MCFGVSAQKAHQFRNSAAACHHAALLYFVLLLLSLPTTQRQPIHPFMTGTHHPLLTNGAARALPRAPPLHGQTSHLRIMKDEHTETSVSGSLQPPKITPRSAHEVFPDCEQLCRHQLHFA
jgi:hypothetical protein